MEEEDDADAPTVVEDDGAEEEGDDTDDFPLMGALASIWLVTRKSKHRSVRL